MAEEPEIDSPEPDDEELDIWGQIEEAEVSLASKITGVTLGILVILVVLGLAAAALGVMYRVTTQGPVDAHLNPLNMIFASRVVVGATRLALLFVAAYVVISCIGLIAERRWLTSLWPLKASDPVRTSVRTLDQTNEIYDAALGDAYATVEALQESNQALTDEITALGDAYDEALDYINRINAERSANASDT